MAYAFDDAAAEGRRKTQFFDIMASRGIYHDGWFASAPGPREPWVGGIPEGVKEWSPLTDKWELYNIDEDWSQANDLAAKNPKKLDEMKSLFLVESHGTRICRSAAASGPPPCSIPRMRPRPLSRNGPSMAR